jgi:CRISPR/Cas system-associated exonuclease Cas4 (RecB family)
MAYQYYNEKHKFVQKGYEDVDCRVERIFDNGHYSHARWQNYLDKAGILKGVWKCINPKCHKIYGDTEKLGIFNPSHKEGWSCSCGCNKLEYEEIRVKSEDQYNFDGHCDAVVDLSESRFKKGTIFDLFVVDFKTIRSEDFFSLTEADPKHVIQVNIYMWILDLKAAVVLYENKDNQEVKEMFVPRDDKLIEKIKKESLELQEVLSCNKLPPRESGYTRSKSPCRFCEFCKICYGG